MERMQTKIEKGIIASSLFVASRSKTVTEYDEDGNVTGVMNYDADGNVINPGGDASTPAN